LISAAGRRKIKWSALPDVISRFKLMKSLNSEVVIAGHGQPTTTIVFDEYEGFYNLLMKRVGEMAAQGKSLNEIKKELKMPEYADWQGQDRLRVNIDAAWKVVTNSKAGCFHANEGGAHHLDGDESNSARTVVDVLSFQ
jgi:hypothetical protein